MTENTRTTDVTIVGDSPSALAAALDFAEVGLAVTLVVPETDAPVAADWPSAAVRDTDGAVSALITRIATAIHPDNPNHDELAPQTHTGIGEFVVGKNGQVGQIPEPNMLGIPGVPLNETVIALAGGSAAFRGYLDRLAPVLKIGKERSLWRLASVRMGEEFARVFVRPHLAARYGVAPEVIEVAAAAPGLNEAVSRAGSLSGGVLATADRWQEYETLVAPAAGWEALRTAALARLELYQAEILTGQVTSLSGEDDVWETVCGEVVVQSRALGVDRGFRHRPETGHPDEVFPKWQRTVLTAPVTSDHTVELPPYSVFTLAAVTGLPDHAAVQVKRLGEQLVAELKLPRETVTFEGGSVAEMVRDETVAAAEKALAAHGFTAAEPWRSRTEAAAFATLEELRAGYAQLEHAGQRQPMLLQTGAARYGGDLGAALSHLTDRTGAMRRVLTGITDK